MGSFATVVFTFTVIAVGMFGLKKVVTPTRKPPTPVEPVGDPLTQKILSLVEALKIEGYFGQVKTPDEALTYIDHPVLADMIEEIEKECDFMWRAPHYRLRYRRVGDDASPEFSRQYTWMLCTPTHAIGFNRKPAETTP